MKITGAYNGGIYNKMQKQARDENLSSGKKLEKVLDNLSMSEKLETQSKTFSLKVRDLQTKLSHYQDLKNTFNDTEESITKLKNLNIKYDNLENSIEDKEDFKELANKEVDKLNFLSKKIEGTSKNFVSKFVENNLNFNNEKLGSPLLLTKSENSLTEVKEKEMEIEEKIEDLTKEIIKLKVANENSVAAKSGIEDEDIFSTMSNIKSKILEDSNSVVTAQSKLSQKRILTILED